MIYLLFILFTTGISLFITESNIGIFLREHPLLKEKKTEFPITLRETIWDLLHCPSCTGFHVGYCVAFTFEYYNLEMISLNTIFGPMLYGFAASLLSLMICSLAIIVSKLAHKL
jgi:hypothetical protein